MHYSQIATDRRFKTLRTGQVVEYQLHDGPKGPHAINVSMDDEPEMLHEAEAVANEALAPPPSEPVEAPERPPCSANSRRVVFRRRSTYFAPTSHT